jgi:hypothetical protein
MILSEGGKGYERYRVRDQMGVIRIGEANVRERPTAKMARTFLSCMVRAEAEEV